MCGLCGILGRGSREDLTARVAAMTAGLAHRGPDAGGTFVADGVALGHRRLSIIDLAETGAQPMTAGDVTVTYNGEIYNYRTLRAELEAIGVGFRGTSDTEVMLEAYRAWGLEGLRRLEGIFALALWDGGRRRLVLMRDRLGVKPLYYAWCGGTLVFGSEIAALHAGGTIARAIDDQALAEYLWFGSSFEERTILRDVRHLPPGHWLVVEEGAPRLEAWWQVEEWLSRPAAEPDLASAASAVRGALDAAVRRQLVADVPVGIFLSGGVDSSAIAASAALASSTRLASYSVGFDFDRGASELPRARQVAERLGLDHHELHVRGDDLADVIEHLARSHGEPFADAANIPLFLLARELRGSPKVVLQGDGGDELFAGYRRYLMLRHARAWRLWPERLGGLARRAGARGRRLARMGEAAGASDPAIQMALLLTVETTGEPPTRLLGSTLRGRLAAADPFLAFRRAAARFHSVRDPVDRMLLTDLHLQLPSQFLPKVDRATMAHGIEARVPLLDEGVAALAVRIPSRLKVRGRQKKIVLREAMRGRLPAAVLDGPKHGFGVPYQEWLRGPLHGFARDTLHAAGFLQQFDVERAALDETLDEHRAGSRDHGFLLWKLLQLALWSKHAAIVSRT